MKAEGVRANGGFRFQVALPPYRYKRKGYIPRVTPSKNMGIAYNAGNERYYIKDTERVLVRISCRIIVLTHILLNQNY